MVSVVREGNLVVPVDIRFAPSWGFNPERTHEIIMRTLELVAEYEVRRRFELQVRNIILRQGRTNYPVGGYTRGDKILVYIDHTRFRPCVLLSHATERCQPVCDWEEALVCVLAHECRHNLGAGNDFKGEMTCEVFARSLLNAWRIGEGRQIYHCERLAWESEIQNERITAGTVSSEGGPHFGEATPDTGRGTDCGPRPGSLGAGKPRGVGGREVQVPGGKGRIAPRDATEDSVAQAAGGSARGGPVVQDRIERAPAGRRTQGTGVPKDPRRKGCRARYRGDHVNARGEIYRGGALVGKKKVKDKLYNPAAGLGATDSQIAAFLGIRRSSVRYTYEKSLRRLRGTLEGIMREVRLNPNDYDDKAIISRALAEVFEERRKRNQQKPNDTAN